MRYMLLWNTLIMKKVSRSTMVLSLNHAIHASMEYSYHEESEQVYHGFVSYITRGFPSIPDQSGSCPRREHLVTYELQRLRLAITLAIIFLVE
ncbi:hypothetical protein RRG08_066948 [Elysia crispata]|uniref:Uncharacterized protein n=1 Tax=Elysia crispata TaxID=231223 RepID=A0AAE1AP32_9GAST|nr:hypothetical protein RRG08_066948 [Elysia crispata]